MSIVGVAVAFGVGGLSTLIVALLVREGWKRATNESKEAAKQQAARQLAEAQLQSVSRTLAEQKRRGNACNESAGKLADAIGEAERAFDGAGGDPRAALGRLRGVAEEAADAASRAASLPEVFAEGPAARDPWWVTSDVPPDERLLGRGSGGAGGAVGVGSVEVDDGSGGKVSSAGKQGVDDGSD